MGALFASTEAEDDPSSPVHFSTWLLDARGIDLTLALLGNRSVARRNLCNRFGSLMDAAQYLRLDDT